MPYYDKYIAVDGVRRSTSGLFIHGANRTITAFAFSCQQRTVLHKFGKPSLGQPCHSQLPLSILIDKLSTRNLEPWLGELKLQRR